MHCFFSGNYKEPEDLYSSLRNVFTLNKWKNLLRKLDQIDSSSETQCLSDSDRCINLQDMAFQIEQENVVGALRRYDSNPEDCFCDSEVSLVREMTRKVDEIIARMSADECGVCGTCGECSAEDLMKGSEVKHHEYECQENDSEMVWESSYPELEHCQGDTDKCLGHVYKQYALQISQRESLK